MSLSLRSGEGCGNSFVLACEAELQATGVGESELGSFARINCGQSYDGLLIVGSAAPDGAVPVRIINRDGSAGGTCLNGLRVAACASGNVDGVFVMDGRRIPWRRVAEGEFALELGFLDAVGIRPVVVASRKGVAVDFWNPHAVFFVAGVEDLPLLEFAAQCDARTELFPAGVNVEMVKRINLSTLQMRVRERGVGETRACGSGAVAVALAAWREGAEADLEVLMPGGGLRLRRRSDGAVSLAGRASLSDCEITA